MLDWQERLVALLRQEGLHQEAAGLFLPSDSWWQGQGSTRHGQRCRLHGGVLRQVIRGRRRWREEAGTVRR